jgi:hypothetical protein
MEQLKAPPYSDFSQQGLRDDKQMKVYCQYCKYSIITNLHGAKCGQCKSFLISYLPSHFDNGQLVK